MSRLIARKPAGKTGSNGDSYRCDACRHTRDRCETCRAARAAYRRDLRERKIADGICGQCTEPAVDGTLCQAHQELNRERSKAAHEKARRSAGIPERNFH